jgi:hypothetical protein
MREPSGTRQFPEKRNDRSPSHKQACCLWRRSVLRRTESYGWNSRVPFSLGGRSDASCKCFSYRRVVFESGGG